MVNKYIENSKMINAVFDRNLKSMDSTQFNHWLCRAFGCMSMCIPDEKINAVLDVVGSE